MDSSASGQRLFSTSRSVTKRAQQEEKQLISQRLKSPFYEGRTMFGGSSAKISRLSSASPYAMGKQTSYLRRIQENDIRRADSLQPLSNSAKQILKSIEKITTPIEDAKRMPVAGSMWANASSADASMSLFEPSRPYRRVSTSKPNLSASSFNLASPATEPSVGANKPLTLKWDSSPASSTAMTRNVLFNSNNAKQSQVVDLEEEKSQVGGKMRARPSTSRHRDAELDSAPSTYPNHELKNVPLPIHSMPTFNFGISNAPSKSASEASITSHSSVSAQAKRSYEDMVSNEHESEFDFSVPKLVKYALMKIRPKKKSDEPTTCSSNLAITNDRSSTSLNTIISVPNSSAAALKFTETTNAGNIATTASSLSSEMAKQPLASVKFSTDSSKVFDDRSAASKSPLKLSMSMFAAPLNTWECDTCLVRNELSAVKCVACEAPKVTRKDSAEVKKAYTGFDFGKVNTKRIEPTTTNASTTTSLMTFGAASEVAAANDTKSIGTATSSLFAGQIGAKENISANLINHTSSTSASVIGSPKSSNDLVVKSNDLLTTKLIAPAQPSSIPANTTNAASSLSAMLNKPLDTSSGPSSNDITKSGDLSKPASIPITNSWGNKFAPAKDTWECSECLVPNKSDATKCISCDTPKAGAAKSESNVSKVSNFQFGSGSAKSSFLLPASSTADAGKISAASKSDKPAFSFGSDTLPSTLSTTSGFSFGNKTTDMKFGGSINDKINDKPSSVSSIFGSKEPATTKVADKDSSTNAGLFAASTPLGKPIENSFGAKFAPPPNSWKCSVCDINNKDSDTKCAACQTARCDSSSDSKTATSTPSTSVMFGADKTSATTTGVRFGSSSFSLTSGSNATSTKSDLFQFGNAGFGSSTVSASTSSSAFPLSSSGSTSTTALMNNTTASTSSAISGANKSGFQGFNFQPQTTTTVAATPTSATSLPTYNFGSAMASSNSAASTPVSTTTANPTPVFTFNSGSKPITASATPGMFVFGSTSSTNAAAPFTSNQTANSITAQPNSFGTPAGTTPFGQSSGGKLAFGQPTATNPSTAAAASNGGFNFAASAALNGSSGNVFGTPNNAAAAPATQFNPGQPTIAFSATPSFNFGVDTSNNVFQFAARTDPSALAPANPHPPRNIRKAKRRLGGPSN